MAAKPLMEDLRDRIATDPELAHFLLEELNRDIGASLKEAREARGLKQKDVAAAMGVNPSRVSQIESTQGVSLTLDVLSRYVNALGCRLDVNIVAPEHDQEPLASVPVVPASFMPAEEVETRHAISRFISAGRSTSIQFDALFCQPSHDWQRQADRDWLSWKSNINAASWKVAVSVDRPVTSLREVDRTNAIALAA